MPGMGTFLQTKNPVVVSAFHAALLHQILAHRSGSGLPFSGVERPAHHPVPPLGRGRFDPAAKNPVTVGAEPVARRVLRIGFGLLWILDGAAAAPIGDAARPARRACSNPRRARRRDGSSTSCTSASRSGPTIPCRPRLPPCGSSSGSGLCSSSRPGVGGPGSPGWSPSGGGSSSGSSARRSAGSSARAPPGSSGHRVPSSSTAWPALSSPCPSGPGRRPRLGRLILRGYGRVPRRHGRPAGLAGPGFLAGLGAGHEHGNAHRHGPPDGPDPAARFLGVGGPGIRTVRRRPRVGGQPRRRGPAGGDRDRVLHGQPRGSCGRPLYAAVTLCAWPTGSSSRTSGSSEGSAPIPTAWCRWRSCSSLATWPSCRCPRRRPAAAVASRPSTLRRRLRRRRRGGRRGRGGTGWLPAT